MSWEPLPPAIGAQAALMPGAPLVWPDRPGNLAFETTLGNVAATRKAFADAARTVSLTVVNQRLVANYLDTRGVVGESDGRRITLTLSSQGSHAVRDILCDHVLKIAREDLRVVTPDVGGGFGTKLFSLPGVCASRGRGAAVPAAGAMGSRAQRALPRRYARSRQRHHRNACPSTTMVASSRSRSIRSRTWGYLSAYAPSASFRSSGYPCCRACTIFPSAISACAPHTPTRCRSSLSRRRAAGGGLRDRAPGRCRRAELGIEPDVLRRRNFIKPRAMPYTTATGKVYDSGDFAGHMARAQELADWAGFSQRARPRRGWASCAA